MKVSSNIAISDSGFLFNPATGESFKVNATGAKVLALLKDGLSEDEIIAKITSEYEVEERELSRDILDFKILLKQYHLVNND